MRVAVVGATGNLGTALLRALAHEPAVTDVVGVARRLPREQFAKTRWRTADIAWDDLTDVFRDVDAVVHLAWLFQPTHDPMTTWRVNAEGSARVFAAVAAAGVKTLAYSSSVGAYSPRHDDQPVDEAWPTHSLPWAAYGREKAYVERALDTIEAANPAMRVVRFRPGFVFQRTAVTEQRRLFGGPLLPGTLLRPGRLPAVPLPAGLRFQALHADDVADAFRRALVTDVAGAFNLAAEPIVDATVLGQVLRTRTIRLPRRLVRAGVAAAWRLHLVPADAALLDLVLSLPLMDTSRARRELGWSPQHTSAEALTEFFEGVADGAGGAMPPLATDSASSRVREVATGVGSRP